MTGVHPIDFEKALQTAISSKKQNHDVPVKEISFIKFLNIKSLQNDYLSNIYLIYTKEMNNSNLIHSYEDLCEEYRISSDMELELKKLIIEPDCPRDFILSLFKDKKGVGVFSNIFTTVGISNGLESLSRICNLSICNKIPIVFFSNNIILTLSKNESNLSELNLMNFIHVNQQSTGVNVESDKVGEIFCYIVDGEDELFDLGSTIAGIHLFQDKIYDKKIDITKFIALVYQVTLGLYKPTSISYNFFSEYVLCLEDTH